MDSGAFALSGDARNVDRNGRLVDRIASGKPARTYTEFRDMVRVVRSLESEGFGPFPRIRKGF